MERRKTTYVAEAAKMPSTIHALHPVLQVPDVEAAITFYRKLGFILTFQDHAQTPRYAAVAREGMELHLQWGDPSQWAYPVDRPVYRFLVEDVDALYEEFKAAGAITPQASDNSPWHQPADTPWGTREFHLRDPGRNSLQFYKIA